MSSKGRPAPGKFPPKGQALCPRCHGTGHLPKFAHVDNGVCYRCRGTGHKKGAELLDAQRDLDDARVQYRRLRNAVRKAREADKQRLQTKLDQLEAWGKRLRDYVDDLSIEIQQDLLPN